MKMSGINIKDILEENIKLKNDLWSVEVEKSILNKENDTYHIQSIEADDYIERLKNELFTNYLHQLYQENLIAELKLALSSYYNFVDEMFPE